MRSTGASGVTAAGFLILVAGGINWRLAVARYNRTVWPPLYEAWKRRWVCRRCGEVWTPGDLGRPTGPVVAGTGRHI